MYTVALEDEGFVTKTTNRSCGHGHSTFSPALTVSQRSKSHPKASLLKPAEKATIYNLYIPMQSTFYGPPGRSRSNHTILDNCIRQLTHPAVFLQQLYSFLITFRTLVCSFPHVGPPTAYNELNQTLRTSRPTTTSRAAASTSSCTAGCVQVTDETESGST
ncbi:hypothetical protein BDZ91DRAFT_710301 [Kalaharituber pfeilii]|nr:hypothetical protein BDZ91DRAFT_710301 [Kalaharituber pfeilii]